MDALEGMFDGDLAYEEDDAPTKVIDARLFAEPIRNSYNFV